MTGKRGRTADQAAHGWEEAGDYLGVVERLIISPSPGRFEPVTVHESIVEAGQVVGQVVRSDERIEVKSSQRGTFMGHLADDGERVRDGQAVAWIRAAS